MDRQEFIDEIERAISLVEEASYAVDMVVQGMRIQANYEAYGRYGFDQLLGNGNPYDSSLQSLIDKTEDDNS
tara:strand:- start:8 stop:223 length:216 start_codon:yes stop_codon:yes gene_type:complete